MAEGIGTCILSKKSRASAFFPKHRSILSTPLCGFPGSRFNGVEGVRSPAVEISYTKARIAAYDLTSVSIIRLVEFPRLGVIGRRFEKKGFGAGVTGPSASVKDG